MNLRALAVLRELQNSPNRESDDALILRAVAEQLEMLGTSIRVVTPEQFDAIDAFDFDVIVPMCEMYPRLKRLQALQVKYQGLILNPPQAVLNCYRLRMVDLLSDRTDVRFPPTEVRPVSAPPGLPPADFYAASWWAKRGDVHNTCDHDVVRVNRWSDMGRVLCDFAEREITHLVLQPHIEGDLVKFYGVGPDRWFTWFYHDPTRSRRLPFEVDELAAAAAAGARTLGLEIFGGDAIIGEDGRITVIDLNSWPSFARVRADASVQIAWHIRSRALTAAQGGARKAR